MILLNDILRLKNPKVVKVRFNLMFRDNWNPIELFRNGEERVMLDGQYWNYSKKSFKVGQITIGFIPIKGSRDLWLLFHIGVVTKDLNVYNAVGYEFSNLPEYEKYFGRLIIKYKNTSQNMIRLAESVINECEVVQILPETFDNELFPGYDKVDISWDDLRRVIDKESWRTALKNQKGVYLITDTSNGKKYVGSAYGEDMILSRWQSYIKNGHGSNVELMNLHFNHINRYFRFSILDIFKSTIDDQTIIDKETWWKKVLLTREFGYNRN